MNPVFTKYHGESVATDSMRLRVLADISSQVCGVVTAPVLRVDEATCCIDYRRIALSTPLIRKLRDQQLASRLGRILARMHAAEFRAPEVFRAETLPLGILGSSAHDAGVLSESIPIGWCHSDFWYGNVFVMNGGDVAVIDPLPQPFLFPDGYIYANGAVDVVTMYTSIIGCHPLVRQLTLPVKSRLEFSEVFMESYLDERGVNYPEVAVVIRRTARAFATRWLERSDRRLVRPVWRMKMAAMRWVMYRLHVMQGGTDSEVVS